MAIQLSQRHLLKRLFLQSFYILASFVVDNCPKMWVWSHNPRCALQLLVWLITAQSQSLIDQAQLTMTLTSWDDMRGNTVEFFAQCGCALKSYFWGLFMFLPGASSASAPCRPLGEPQRRDELGPTPNGAFHLVISKNFYILTHFSAFWLDQNVKKPHVFGWPEQHACFSGLSHSVSQSWTPSSNKMSISSQTKAPERLNHLLLIHGALAFEKIQAAWSPGLALQSTPATFRESRWVRLWISCEIPIWPLENVKINFHLHLIFLFVTATIVCLNKEVASEPLWAVHRVQARAQIGGDTDVNEQEDQAEHYWNGKPPWDCQAPRCLPAAGLALRRKTRSCLRLPFYNLMGELRSWWVIHDFFPLACILEATHQIWGWECWLKIRYKITNYDCGIYRFSETVCFYRKNLCLEQDKPGFNFFHFQGDLRQISWLLWPSFYFSVKWVFKMLYWLKQC